MNRITDASLAEMLTAYVTRRVQALGETLRVVCLVVNGERFAVLFQEGDESNAMRVGMRWASDPDLAFTMRAADVMSESIARAKA